MNWTTLIISIVIAVIFFIIQFLYFSNNLKKLKIVRNFFNKEKDYEVLGEGENSQLNPYVAPENSNLRKLILELNEYTEKNHGTTDFSIIQNKTERKIELLYEDATSRLAFPIYIGLMGTFLGVFLGLLLFDIGLSTSKEGITDESISNLIWGVLISMSTSFCGLLLSTISNHKASEVRKIVDEDKSTFFDYIQTELMPTLGVSMVAALNKLHHTINLFEPSFNRVIDRFQNTFDSCTQRFGNAFEQNVVVVSEAVRVMGANMDKINENVDLQAQLLKTLKSKGVVDSLNAFVRAAQHFDYVTDAINKFEEERAKISRSIVDLVDTQRQYNNSLEIPLSVANKINAILARVTDFEKSINALGKSIEKTQLLGNSELELVKEQLTAIKKKQTLAMHYIETADGHLEDIFKKQGEVLRDLNKKFEASIQGYADKLENVLEGLGKEMQQRRTEIVAALEEKFSLDQIQQEFTQLNKLSKIEELLTSINTKSSREEIDSVLKNTREEVQSIRETLSSLIEEAKKKPEPEKPAAGGGIFGGLFGGRNR